MLFGDNLIALREKRGIGRKDLAERLNIPYTTLRNYETNTREPGHKLLLQIADMFSISVDSLIRPEQITADYADSLPTTFAPPATTRITEKLPKLKEDQLESIEKRIDIFIDDNEVEAREVMAQ